MANTGLRPDEAKNLQHRDVAIVMDDATRQGILEIEVRGKRGIGHCKSTPSAVHPYQRLLSRPKHAPQGRKPRSRKAIVAAEALPQKAAELPQPNDHVFLATTSSYSTASSIERNSRKIGTEIRARLTACATPTYACARLEGADIYQIAKNCRTSVEMIEKFYAAHLKHTLDAAAINVRKPKPRVRATEVAEFGDD